MGVNLRVQSWNCNSLMKKQKSWLQFTSKLRNSNENVFTLIDTRFGHEHEREFERLWDGPIYFNSFSSNQRGLMVLFRESFPIKNVKIETKRFLCLLILDLNLSKRGSLKNCGTGQFILTPLAATRGD